MPAAEVAGSRTIKIKAAEGTKRLKAA